MCQQVHGSANSASSTQIALEEEPSRGYTDLADNTESPGDDTAISSLQLLYLISFAGGRMAAGNRPESCSRLATFIDVR